MATEFQGAYGPWALVSGASAGIGAEFVRQLAGRGLNLVLVARRQAALDALAAEIESAFKVRVRPVALDLTSDGAAARLADLTSDLDLGLVVLNAGVLTGGRFLAADLAGELNLIRLNVVSTLELAHRFGNRLHHRGGGGLILVSSISGYWALPYQASYAASKAFVSSFGLALREELASTGVRVLVLVPGPTKTNLFLGSVGLDMTKLGISKGSPVAVVRAALDGLGHKAIVIPGAMNRVYDALGKYILPRKTMARILGRTFSKGLVAKGPVAEGPVAKS